MTRIEVMAPWVGAEEVAAAAAVIESGWLAQGPMVARFEEAFAARQEAREALAVSSCTAALHLALVVGGVLPGDDVVVPSLSFIATANAVRHAGARPVFADVEPATGTVTAESVRAVITAATTAVIAVDQGGSPFDLRSVRAVTDPLGVLLLEDAACAAGSEYHGHPVGVEAEIAAWSFHPRKLITTGEGGMLTTTSHAWRERARRLREHGMTVSAADRHRQLAPAPEGYAEVGWNYRMTDLQAAVGLVQLGRLDAIVERRRAIARRYTEALAGIEGLRAVADPPWGRSNVQSFWIEIGEGFALDRECLLARLGEYGVSARRGIMAIHLQEAYADAGSPAGSLPVTERIALDTLILPVHHGLSDGDVDRVAEIVREARHG